MNRKERDVKKNGTIIAFVYDVRKKQKTSNRLNTQTLYKVSWCDTYLSAADKTGAKWVICKGDGKKVTYTPVVINKKKIYCYVLEKYIPVPVQEVCAVNGRASHEELQTLKQADITYYIPPFLHPLLTKDLVPKDKDKVLSYFTQN